MAWQDEVSTNSSFARLWLPICHWFEVQDFFSFANVPSLHPPRTLVLLAVPDAQQPIPDPSLLTLSLSIAFSSYYVPRPRLPIQPWFLRFSRQLLALSDDLSHRQFLDAVKRDLRSQSPSASRTYTLRH